MARASKPAKGRKPPASGKNKPMPVAIVEDTSTRPPAIPESAKLSANYINGIAIGVFISGALIPTLAVLQAPGSNIDPLWLGATVICTAVSGALHLLARYLLGRTEQ